MLEATSIDRPTLAHHYQRVFVRESQVRPTVARHRRYRCPVWPMGYRPALEPQEVYHDRGSTGNHQRIQAGDLGRHLLSTPMGLLFKGVAKKALLQGLNDIKSAVERK